MVDIRLMHHLESYLTERRRERFINVLSQRTKHFTVAIEDVYQLHNTSAVIRSCDVFGIQELQVIEEQNSKRIDREIAMGAQKWVDVHRYETGNACIDAMRAKGYRIIATTPHEDNCDLESFQIGQPACFFFGRETIGLSENILDQADEFLKIPMVGFTESLNVSVSAAIILQRLTYRLKQSDVNWQLTDDEIHEKRIDWCKKTIKSIDSVLSRYNSSQ